MKTSRDISRWIRLADEEALAVKEHWFNRLARTGGYKKELEIIPSAYPARRIIRSRRT